MASVSEECEKITTRTATKSEIMAADGTVMAILFRASPDGSIHSSVGRNEYDISGVYNQDGALQWIALSTHETPEKLKELAENFTGKPGAATTTQGLVFSVKDAKIEPGKTTWHNGDDSYAQVASDKQQAAIDLLKRLTAQLQDTSGFKQVLACSDAEAQSRSPHFDTFKTPAFVFETIGRTP